MSRRWLYSHSLGDPVWRSLQGLCLVTLWLMADRTADMIWICCQWRIIRCRMMNLSIINQHGFAHFFFWGGGSNQSISILSTRWSRSFVERWPQPQWRFRSFGRSLWRWPWPRGSLWWRPRTWCVWRPVVPEHFSQLEVGVVSCFQWICMKLWCLQ